MMYRVSAGSCSRRNGILATVGAFLGQVGEGISLRTKGPDLPIAMKDIIQTLVFLEHTALI